MIVALIKVRNDVLRIPIKPYPALYSGFTIKMHGCFQSILPLQCQWINQTLYPLHKCEGNERKQWTTVFWLITHIANGITLFVLIKHKLKK